MHYVSTRGEAPAAGFRDVLLAGLAPDGGLYLPQAWPPAPAPPLPGERYVDVAARCLQPFMGGWPAPAEFRADLEAAYASFADPRVAPLRAIGPDSYLLELFHGPTLAFKDVAMQLLARLIDRALAERGARALVIGATSGDTGAAAVAALAERPRLDLVILFPHGRVSEVQRRQMTTSGAANVHAIALQGTFDDAQSVVKALFADAAFRTRTNLAAINSINWARILFQAVYYATAAAALGPATFVVPTGNFGDVYAGHVAASLGVKVARLVIATNENDILVRALATGRYAPRGVVATSSPAMDIQLASNFERVLFEALGRDAGAVRAAFADLRTRGAFEIAPRALAWLRARFAASRAGTDDVAAMIRETWQRARLMIDPHTAVGLVAARALGGGGGPVVTLATAHPAKFPDSVVDACGEAPLPHPRLSGIMDRDERLTVLPADAAAVRRHVLEKVIRP